MKIFNRTATIAGLTLSVALLSSCGVLTYDTMSSYFDKHMTEMKVVDYSFDASYPLDSDGIANVPSDKSCTLTFVVKNPQGRKITPVVKNSADTNELMKTISTPYTFASTEDYNYITVTLSREMLYLLEMGNSVNPIVSFTADGYTDEVGSFTAPIRANSPPPPVEGACVMIDTSNPKTNSIGWYVVCFNLPEQIFDESGIHADVAKIYIDGMESGSSFAKGVNLGIDFNDDTYNLNKSYSSTLKRNTTNLQFAVDFIPQKYPAYIKSSVPVSDEESHQFTITLADKCGLSSSVAVNTQELRLATVTSNLDSYTAKTDGSYALNLAMNDGTEAHYATVTFVAPTKTNNPLVSVTDASVAYRLYTKNSGGTYDLFTEGVDLNDLSFDLPKGAYKIEAYAQKEGYVDSEMSTWIVLIGDVTTTTVSLDVGLNATCVFSMTPLLMSKRSLPAHHTLSLTIVPYSKTTGKVMENFTVSDIEIAVKSGSIYQLTDMPSADPYQYNVPLSLEQGSYSVVVSFTYFGEPYSCSFALQVIQ